MKRLSTPLRKSAAVVMFLLKRIGTSVVARSILIRIRRNAATIRERMSFLLEETVLNENTTRSITNIRKLGIPIVISIN